MRKLFLHLTVAAAVVLGLFAGPNANAQGYVELMYGGSSYQVSSNYDVTYTPYTGWYSHARHQYLITASDLAALGLIPTGPVEFNSLSFFVDAVPNSQPLSNFTIRMKNTSATQLSGFDLTNLTQVYGPTTEPLPPAGDWLEHSFSQNFIWDGVGNIIVDVCFDNGNSNYTYSWNIRYGAASSSYRTAYFYSDGYTGQACTTPPYQYVSSTNYIPWMRLGCGGSSSITEFISPSLVYVPGVAPINWTLGHPTKAFVGAITFNLYTPDGQLISSEAVSGINVPAGGQATGTHNFNVANIPPGFYRIEGVFDALNSCFFMDKVYVDKPILMLAPGMTMCLVWPGDVNNDGVVNYGDRGDLNTYIHDANLSTLWLNGPQRYRTDQDIDPLTYIRWEEQPGVPWNTPEGCYMDSDGNGVVNNFDYIAVKLNWFRTHGSSGSKAAPKSGVAAFDLQQNYPNPFNPSTSITYNVAERSQVTLVVTDMLGRTVETLVDDVVDAGSYSVRFDASSLSSGMYLATVAMTAPESGMTFSKTIRMTLSK